jgi:hypothetical protein
MLPAAAAILAQTAPPPASVSGTVTNSVTGEPILRAHVTVRCNSEDRQQGPRVFGALTNGKGEFSITPLPPGDCAVEAQRVGFVAPPKGTSYSLASGTHKEDIKLTLTPTGAITGRVVDAAGDPAQGVNVSIDAANGSPAAATSDDKGQFRIGGLRPGKYRVRATPQTMPFPPEIRSDGSTELHNAATYYPDSLSAKTAQRLEVRAGAEVSGVDIRLVRTPIVQVSGKVTGVPPGAKNVMVTTFPSGSSAGIKPDGTFSLWGLDPGKYTLVAQQWAGQTTLMSAPVEIEVAGANIEHLELRMVAPFEMAGELRFDDEQAREPVKPPTRPDGTAPPVPPPATRRVELRPVDRQTGQVGNSSALVGADDSFTLEKVQPARYRVVINGTSEYVKSLRAGETESDGDILDVRNGSAGPLTVTMSSNFCEVSGTVNNSKGPVTDATVVLSPLEDPWNLRTTSSDSTGTYKFRVPPGKWKLAAVDEESREGYMNSLLQMAPRLRAEMLDDYQEVTESLDLSAGDKITKDLVQIK